MKTPAKLKVLMIGNSFSICVGKNLPQITAASPRNLELTLGSAYIGGCSLETHWKNLEAIEHNPDAPEKNAYLNNIWHSAEQDREKDMKETGNVRDLLKMEDWDVISIQQASHFSAFPETYQPWADHLLNYLHNHAPRAKIVIQQTWAYRSDDSRITPLRKPDWGFHQDEMFQKLSAAYAKLAEYTHSFVIPTGLAVQLTRQNDPLKFQPSESFENGQMHWPDIPPQAGDPVGQAFWCKGASGEMELRRDTIHLNVRGEYLQACVWFRCLFGLSAVNEIHYESPSVGSSDCAFLRKMADLAVDQYPQVAELF